MRTFALAGPGVLTRSLLKLPKSKLKKLIVLENGENYLKYLQACLLNISGVFALNTNMLF